VFSVNMLMIILGRVIELVRSAGDFEISMGDRLFGHFGE
jgi:hypothetical protein